MVLEIEKAPSASVRCLRCQRPIPLPAPVLKRKRSFEAEPGGSSRELASHVFLLWCGSCRKESLYLFDDVVPADGGLESAV
jgi:hypothetical protein